MNRQHLSRMAMVVGTIALGATMLPLEGAVAGAPTAGSTKSASSVLALAVRVVNGAGDPVPVSGSLELTGTPNVNVTNTPNVNVANTPNVRVDGPVTVGGSVQASQAGAWAVGIEPTANAVTVSNTNHDPLLVRDVADINFQPFHRDLSSGCATVPDSGSYSVIEFVTWSAAQQADQWSNIVPFVETIVVGTRVQHALAYNVQFIEADEQLGFPAINLLSASHATQLFVHPGSPVCIEGPGEVLYASISGRTV